MSNEKIYMSGCHLVIDVPDGIYYMVIYDEALNEYSEIFEITGKSEFEIAEDGVYKIYLFTIPNVTFNDGKLYVGTVEVYDSERLVKSQIANQGTISGTECIEQEVLCICKLKKCLVNLQLQAFKEGTQTCGNSKCKTSENKSQRDYIFLGVWLIEQYLQRGLLENAQNVYNCLQSCGSICGNLLKSKNDCGCNG